MEARMNWLALGGVLLTLMTVAQAALPQIFYFLPLGGSAIAQMGITLGIAVAIDTTAKILRSRDG